MQIVVHHLKQSRSHRILWLLEELGQAYDIVEYARDPKTMRAGPELRALHPLGKSPLVELDGIVLAESGAIVEELVDAFDIEGTLRPKSGTEAHRRYRYFLHYAEGSLMTPLLVALLTSQVRKAKLPFFVRPVASRVADGIDDKYTKGELDAHFAFLEGHLAAHSWFAGDAFSAADVQMSYGLLAALARGGVGDRPQLARWVTQIEERPAYQRAVERGGPPLPPG